VLATIVRRTGAGLALILVITVVLVCALALRTVKDDPHKPRIGTAETCTRAPSGAPECTEAP
jgi:hypothetical protein